MTQYWNPRGVWNGGTINGSLTITGNLTVLGDFTFGDISTDTLTVEGKFIQDVTSTEAMLIRKNGDTGDILTVDTSNNYVWIGQTSSINARLRIGASTGGYYDQFFSSGDMFQDLSASGSFYWRILSGIKMQLTTTLLDCNNVRARFRQSNATGAAPILDLTQLDVDQSLINFSCTAGSGNGIDNRTTSGATTHHVKVKLNGTEAWIPASTNAPS